MKDFRDMSAEELVKTYRIARHEDVLRIYDAPKKDRESFAEHLRAVKPMVMGYLLEKERAKKQASDDLAAKINAIPGLQEIRHAQADLQAWHRELAASFEGAAACSGLGVRAKPIYDLDGMYKQYPKAAAYLKAEEWSRAANYAKSAAGKNAADKIWRARIIMRPFPKWRKNGAHIAQSIYGIK